jgi:UDP-N-acetylmuramoyl-tripeptide--D-alanyl-D-alanine ligase
LVLEMAMRGRGQIAELAAMASPDVGVIVTIGPAHLDLLGSLEAIAAAKCELLAGLGPDSVAVVPTAEPLIEPHLRTDIKTTFFGEGGDVELIAVNGRDLTIRLAGSEVEISVNFDQAHNRSNLLAALAAADAVGVRPPSDLSVNFSALRGERIELPRDIMLINDCYNSNPQSLGAGLADLASESERRGGRAVAVLGDMLELGPEEIAYHREAGMQAEALGVGLLIAVGPLAANMTATFNGPTAAFPNADAAADALGRLLQPEDTVLLKGSRGIGLDAVAKRLGEGA